MSSTVTLQKRIAEQAETRAAEAARRSDALQEKYDQTLQEYAEVQDRYRDVEVRFQDQSHRFLDHAARVGVLEAERSSLDTRMEELVASKEHHIRALEQARAAITASSVRTEELEAQWRQARDQMTQMEADLTEARIELEARTAETEALRERLLAAENSWARSREEADRLRALTTGSLGELLDMHRDLKSDEDRASRGHEERVQALEREATSLRNMLQEAEQRVEAAQQEVLRTTNHARDTEKEQRSLCTQLNGIRVQLQSVVGEAGKLRKDLAVKEAELQEKTQQAGNAELRLAMFRNYFAEHGEAIDEDDLRSKIGEAPARVVELENKLAARMRIQESMEKDLDDAIRRRDDLEQQVKKLGSQLEHVRSKQSPSSSNGEDWEGRALESEQKLTETEQTYKAKLQQMEDDYQLAVKYVK